MTELDLAWDDVLRRARRRRPRRRLVLAAVVAVAALGGGPALGVLLTRSTPPELAYDRIVGPVTAISDSRYRTPLLEFGRWRGHDGICYLVPRVHAGCILRGERTKLFFVLPRILHRRLVRAARFSVLYTGRYVERIGVHGRVLSRSPIRR